MIAVSLPSNVGGKITFPRVFDLTNRVSCEQVHLLLEYVSGGSHEVVITGANPRIVMAWGRRTPRMGWGTWAITNCV